jgi:hypothetical protein
MAYTVRAVSRHWRRCVVLKEAYCSRVQMLYRANLVLSRTDTDVGDRLAVRGGRIRSLGEAP